ncbi:MAG: peptidylprolyl isomerase [Pseudomonadota bacterium]|nr:peptidylprolyl isomerase [Pseudomonadota bacterium]
MTRHLGLSAVAAAICIVVGLHIAGDVQARPTTVADLLAATSPKDWRRPDPDSTLYLQLSSGRVIIELAPRVAPHHVANIKALIRAHYFDGLAILRVQDNYVVQWADPGTHRPVPGGVTLVAPELTADPGAYGHFEPLPDHDLYAAQVGFIDGFPAGRDPRSHTTWLAHCYGMVGVGRDDAAESDGTEMYAVIGNAPRHLDRNVALVGRVLQGVELLSSLPRGSGEMGFYVKPEPLVPIVSMRLATDVPEASRVPIEVLRTDSEAFRKITDQLRNRRDDWFKYHPGRIDLCSIPLPVRPAPPGR